MSLASRARPVRSSSSSSRLARPDPATSTRSLHQNVVQRLAGQAEVQRRLARARGSSPIDLKRISHRSWASWTYLLQLLDLGLQLIDAELEGVGVLARTVAEPAGELELGAAMVEGQVDIRRPA